MYRYEELYPGYLGQKNIQPMSRSFLTSTTVDKINLTKLKERQTKLLNITVSMGLVKGSNCLTTGSKRKQRKTIRPK